MTTTIVTLKFESGWRECMNGWIQAWQRSSKTQIWSQILLQSLSHYRKNSHFKGSTHMSYVQPYFWSKEKPFAQKKPATYKSTAYSEAKCHEYDPWHGAWKVRNPPELQSSQKLYTVQQQHIWCECHRCSRPLPCIDHLGFVLGARDLVQPQLSLWPACYMGPEVAALHWVFLSKMWVDSPTT